MTETGWWILLGVVLLALCASAVRYDVWWALLRGRLLPPAGEPEGDARERRPAHGGHRPHHPTPHQRPAFHRSGRRN